MIDAAIKQIQDSVNLHLMQTSGRAEDVVVTSNLMEQDGTVSPHVNDKIVISLVNIEKDTTAVSQQRVANASTMRSTVTSPPLNVNLYLMFASYFGGNRYPVGLEFISRTILYLQGQSVFDRHNSPELDARISKLVLDIHNLDINDLSNLWGVLGGKYLPSVLYKVRMVTMDSSAITGQVSSILQTDAEVKA